MNAFWKDSNRREIIVAAAAGFLWALLLYLLPAPSPLRGGLGRGEAEGTRDAQAKVRPCTSFITQTTALRSGDFGSPVLGCSRLLQGEGSRGNANASASCRIHNHLRDGSTNIGSGTLIDVTSDRRAGLVLSCAHLFTEGVGRVIVEFADGRTHGANLVAVDRDADLSALEIATPAASAATIGAEIDYAGPLTACGFGPNGQYRCIAGSVVGAVEGAGQTSLKMSGAVRSGDSGGGVFDGQGRLVAVVWGESGGVTYASCGRPLQRFLERVRSRSAAPNSLASGRAVGVSPPLNAATLAACPNGLCPLTGPRVVMPSCPNGTCPLVRPGSLGAAAGGSILGLDATGDCNCGCNTQLAAIAARIASLESGKQNRGDYVGADDLAPYARADQLAQLDQQNAERHQSLLDRLENFGPLVGAAGRAAVPLATTALGISGPVGWGILAATSIGGWLIGRRMKRKLRGAGREAREKSEAEQLAPRASQLAPSPEATAAAEGAFRNASAASVRVETQQPVERDDREARELLRLSQLEGRDPLQDAVAGRLALDRLDAAADGDADPQHARWADDLRRELRERFNEIAPTKFQMNAEVGVRNAE